jgi:anaerobic selenocysteine-containing dehydrogenase
VQPVRQPTIAPIPETAKVYGEEMPISMEALLMALAEKLGMPGFGPKGFKNGMDFKRPEDLYLKMVANLSFGEKADGSDAVPEASDAELEVFLKARRHLPKSVFDVAKWRDAVGEKHFRRLVYVLNRGGRFEDFEKVYLPDGTVGRKYGRQINLFLDKQATTNNAMTGKPYGAVAAYIPPYRDALDRPIRDEGFDLKLITHRIITQTKSRTIASYWLTQIDPENFIAVSASDAARLKLKDGQPVKVVSATNPQGVWDLGNGNSKPMVGKVKVIQGIRPGTIAFSLGYGHWGYGATDVEIDGQVVKADTRRAKGVHANAAMRVDPVLGDTTLTDITGGSAVFYDTLVRLEPVS